MSHGRLLDRIPSLPDLQSAWLLLLMCAAPRSNYPLPSLAPSLTDGDRIARCLATSSPMITLYTLTTQAADGLRCPKSSKAWDYALHWKAEGRHTGHLGQILCQSCADVTRVLWRKPSAACGCPAWRALTSCRKPGSRCRRGMHLPMAGARLLLLNASLESRCEDGSEPPMPAWAPPLAQAFFLTVTRLHER